MAARPHICDLELSLEGYTGYWFGEKVSGVTFQVNPLEDDASLLHLLPEKVIAQFHVLSFEGGMDC